MKPRLPPSRRMAGNVLFIILIAIVLFAALSYAVTSGERQQGGLSKEKIAFASVAIMRYGADLQGAVQGIMGNGTDVSMVSFSNATLGGYDNVNDNAGGADTPANMVFNAMKYVAPDAAWLDSAKSADTYYGEWYFPANVCVASVGMGTDVCGSDAVNNEELVAILPYVAEGICIEIDKKAGVPLCGGLPCANAGAVFPPTDAKYTGAALQDGSMIHAAGGEFDTKHEGCLRGAVGTYYYYKVLAER